MQTICILQPQRKFKADNLYVKRIRLGYPENLLYTNIPDSHDCVWTLERDDLPPLLACCMVPLDEWKYVWGLVYEQVKSEMNLRQEQKRINMELFSDVRKGSRKQICCNFLCCFKGELKQTLMEVDKFDNASEEQWNNLVDIVSQMFLKYGIVVTREPVKDELDATYGLMFETENKK